MDEECPFCKALHWKAERLKRSTERKRRYGMCCLQGKIQLPQLQTLPAALKRLYDGNDERSKSSRAHMREYNATFAFTSLGVQMDNRLLGQAGPQTFVIHGELRHRTGSLILDEGTQPKYSQLYIYDPATALPTREARNPDLRHDVLAIIQDVMLENNMFIQHFQQAHEVLQHATTVSDQRQNIPAYLHYTANKDKCRYNLPSADEVAIILPGDGTEFSYSRDIVLHLKGGQRFTSISECHPAYLPLHYVLMYLHGKLGWLPELKQWDTTTNECTDKRLTQMVFYSYFLFERKSEYSPILRGKKLFEEFLCDGWAATEQNQLRYLQDNQPILRAEVFQDIPVSDAETMDATEVGKRIILPSSHIGSPRHMYEIFQDSMAITRYNRHPDIFLTMPANPQWPEIQESLFPFQNACDRPELVARVFEQKRQAIMDEIKKKGVFGNIVAHVYTIEFQKRGLPHMHALFYLKEEDKIRTAAQIDGILCAEIPDKDTDPELFATVIRCMIHGPCGNRNEKAPCMEDKHCQKNYPRSFVDSTIVGEDGYPTYRRRDTGITYTVKNSEVDNRDVVPYNPHHSRMFDCHINVEVCASVRCVKYIHKYIFKGYDKTTMVLLGVNEIQIYIDARYIGPVEAAWRLLGFSMHQEVLNVVRLTVHLPGYHQVLFNPKESLAAVIERARNQKSTLTAFLDFCANNPEAQQYTYQEFPEHYCWDKPTKTWRKRAKGFAIGRMYFCSPNAGDQFYLRLLLTLVKGPKSFDDLKTVDGQTFGSFKEACIARGLLEDDSEWAECLKDAATIKTGHQIRRLFVVILTECNPTNPYQLWNDFKQHICDDLHYKLRKTHHIPNPTEDQIYDYGLHLINKMLFETGKTLQDFPTMPIATQKWEIQNGNRFIWEQQQHKHQQYNHQCLQNVGMLNEEQKDAYNAVLQSVQQRQGKVFFLNGPAGTGKTFVYNNIAATCRSQEDIVLMVASSGIASLLLCGGRTAHSMFSIPFDILNDSNCGISKQSAKAELFKNTKLIIWDEVPMQHKYCIEAVDRSLRDICNSDKPFGGIMVVLGGDFRQCLPVVPKGTREQIVAASLRSSYLWNDIQILKLVRNMRFESSDETLEFANTLTEIGSIPSEAVNLHNSINRCLSIDELIDKTYPGLGSSKRPTEEFLNERIILAPRSDDVDCINIAALEKFLGETITKHGADTIPEIDPTNPSEINRFPSEYVNNLQPDGLPPFTLHLKKGCPIILLQNIAPVDGMCNGTRLRVEDVKDHCINATILTGEKAGEQVFIPRISLTPSASETPVQFSRRQFPVRLAYAMTINKAQGQSVKYVGVDLWNEVFSHGQLYVALSRCTSVKRICVALPTADQNTTTNIVYPEVLL